MSQHPYQTDEVFKGKLPSFVRVSVHANINCWEQAVKHTASLEV